MKRVFSKKQRQALALFSSGYCMNCNAVLDTSFHADHIVPFSKGGITDVVNGQALCPTCNLKKGNRMPSKIQLREWQKDAGYNCVKNFKDGNKFFLLQATPGGGKTVCALSIAKEMIDAGIVSHVAIIVPSTTLVKQWQTDALKNYGYELANGMIYNTMQDFHLYRGIVMTYQGMNESNENLRLFCAHNKTLVIADEMHHVADGQSWGSSFRNAFSESKHILGLTGTPWASKGQSIPFVNYDDDGYSIPDFRYSKKQAIADKVCRAVQFHPMKATNLKFFDERTGDLVGEYNSIEDAKSDGVPRPYMKTLQNLTHMRTLFTDANNQLVELRSDGVVDAGGLVVAPSIDAAHKFRDEIYMLTGIEYPIVHSKEPSSHKIISEFRTSKVEWLISVDMVTEGVDIKRLQVCVFLSQKNTELFVRQVIGRIERVRNKNNSIDLTGFFFFTDTIELSDLIRRIEEENKAGLELLICGDCGENPCVCVCEVCALKPCVCPCDVCEKKPCVCDPPTRSDDIVLEDLDTEFEGLIAQGMKFDRELVKEAMIRKRGSAYVSNWPLYMVCTALLSEKENEKYMPEDYDVVPLDVKKERIRSRIQKRIIRELSKFYGRKPTGQEIKDAHKNVNRAVGIKNTDDSVSFELLETKMDFISNVDAEVWA